MKSRDLFPKYFTFMNEKAKEIKVPFEDCIYKENKDSLIWQLDEPNMIGEHYFSFDKETWYNFYSDFPHKLTEEEIKIFAKENPTWASLKIDISKILTPEELEKINNK